MIKSFFTIAPDESDCLLTFGVLAVFFGVLCVYPPAAYILVGVGFIYLAYQHQKAESLRASKYVEGSLL